MIQAVSTIVLFVAFPIAMIMMVRLLGAFLGLLLLVFQQSAPMDPTAYSGIWNVANDPKHDEIWGSLLRSLLYAVVSGAITYIAAQYALSDQEPVRTVAAPEERRFFNQKEEVPGQARDGLS